MSRATPPARPANWRTRPPPWDRRTGRSASCVPAPPGCRPPESGPQGFCHSCRNYLLTQGRAVELPALPPPCLEQLVERVVVEPRDVQLALAEARLERVVDGVGRHAGAAEEAPKPALL